MRLVSTDCQRPFIKLKLAKAKGMEKAGSWTGWTETDTCLEHAYSTVAGRVSLFYSLSENEDSELFSKVRMNFQIILEFALPLNFSIWKFNWRKPGLEEERSESVASCSFMKLQRPLGEQHWAMCHRCGLTTMLEGTTSHYWFLGFSGSSYTWCQLIHFYISFCNSDRPGLVCQNTLRLNCYASFKEQIFMYNHTVTVIIYKIRLYVAEDGSKNHIFELCVHLSFHFYVIEAFPITLSQL